MKQDKEWLLTELRNIDSTDNNNEFVFGYETAIDLAIDLVNQLDEPEKVVIPQFVADWWGNSSDTVILYGGKCVDKRHKFDLISTFNESGLDDHLSKVEVWLDENASIFIEVVNGKLYEVEKEPLYFISFPTPNSGHINMWRNTDTGSYYFAKSSNLISQDGYKCTFTEKEIKEHDERFWPFAVSVEESP